MTRPHLGPNYLWHHVYFGCFDLLLESDRKKEHLAPLDLSASPQVKMIAAGLQDQNILVSYVVESQYESAQSVFYEGH